MKYDKPYLCDYLGFFTLGFRKVIVAAGNQDVLIQKKSVASILSMKKNI